MELALTEIAAEAATLERKEEELALKKVAAAKEALSSAEETMASMNRIRTVVREANLLNEETFSDDDVDIVVDEWINRRKLFNASRSFEQATTNHISKEACFQTNQKVCFVLENNTTMLIESSAEFSKNEIKRYWYSKEEEHKMRKRCNQVAEQLESRDSKNRRFCSRGLETSTRKGLQTAKATIKACRNAVMKEQDIQWWSVSEDHHRLAMVSQQVSKCSMDQAVMRANEDEREARKIQRQDHKQKLNPPRLPILKASRTLAVLGTKSRYRITTRSA